MDSNRISSLLSPFVATPLSPAQVDALGVYLNLLLRWNARLNLTAVRDPEHIVTRHFGESLFAATQLLDPDRACPQRAIDVGSGPGFPGLPMKIFCPHLRLTLIESQHKKVSFLREVIRALRLQDTDVFAGRAEEFPDQQSADLVTLRAVERFDMILPVAASLLRPVNAAQPKPGEPPEVPLVPGDVVPDSGLAGPSSSFGGLPIVSGAKGGDAAGVPRLADQPGAPRLALLIGESQVAAARQLTPNFDWKAPVGIPESSARIVLVGAPKT